MMICQLCWLPILHNNYTDRIRLNVVSSHFCWHWFRFFIRADLLSFALFTNLCSPSHIFAGVSPQERQPTYLSWLRHILFITAKLAIKYYSLYPIWHFYFSINMSLKYVKNEASIIFILAYTTALQLRNIQLYFQFALQTW